MTGEVAYFDHGSTAPLRNCARDAMEPYLREKYGNASSVYSLGREARAAVDKARDRAASILGASPREIIFTSGGTESIIHSLVGAFAGNRLRGNHILTTSFEHHAVHAVFDFLADEMGADAEMVGVDGDGLVRLDELEDKIRDDTVLVSVMRVNNEVGTIQDVKSVAEICSGKNILVHSDCVQAAGKIPVDFSDMPVDMAVISGHKFGGPKGMGILYIREGTHIKSLCEGSHEFGIRAGTENVAGIVGMVAALDESVEQIQELSGRLANFKERLWKCIKRTAPDASVNGSEDKTVPAILNVRLPGCEGESIVIGLDREGIAASVGSACQAGATEPSHVLNAMGLSQVEAFSSIRLSMGYSTTQEDVERFIKVFPDVYSRVRKDSEIYTSGVATD